MGVEEMIITKNQKTPITLEVAQGRGVSWG